MSGLKWWEWPLVILLLPVLWLARLLISTVSRLVEGVARLLWWTLKLLWSPFAWAGRQLRRAVHWLADTLGVPVRRVWRALWNTLLQG